MSRIRLRGPDEESLTIFGEWVNTLAAILHTDYHEIGRYTRPPMSHSVISRAARNPNGPSRKIVPRIWDALYWIAEARDGEKGRQRFTSILNHFARDAFYNAGGIESEDQRAQSAIRLRALQTYQDVIQENDQQAQIIALLEEEVALLRQEKKQLRP